MPSTGIQTLNMTSTRTTSPVDMHLCCEPLVDTVRSRFLRLVNHMHSVQGQPGAWLHVLADLESCVRLPLRWSPSPV